MLASEATAGFEAVVAAGPGWRRPAGRSPVRERVQADGGKDVAGRETFGGRVGLIGSRRKQENPDWGKLVRPQIAAYL
jgi:hypothetical protein